MEEISPTTEVVIRDARIDDMPEVDKMIQVSRTFIKNICFLKLNLCLEVETLQIKL